MKLMKKKKKRNEKRNHWSIDILILASPQLGNITVQQVICDKTDNKESVPKYKINDIRIGLNLTAIFQQLILFI